MAGHQVFSSDSIGALTKLNSTTVQLASSVTTLGGLQYDSAALQVLTASSGAGGIDTGSIAANTIYYVYVVLSGSDAALTASISASAPTGFSIYKKVGGFATDSASAVDNAGNKTIKETDSMVRLYTSNGVGGSSSGEVNIRNFLTQVGSTSGKAISYSARTTTTGDFFTINEDGVYNITFSDTATANSIVGLSLNSSQLSTNVTDITEVDMLAMGAMPSTIGQGLCSWSGGLLAGDIIRAHSQGDVGGDASYVNFTIIKIGKTIEII